MRIVFPRGRTRAASVALASALALTVCGAEVEEHADGSGKVPVKRCAEKVDYSVPQRAVAYEGGSADKLFSLGLTDHVLGYVMPPANPPVSQSPWAKEYAKVEKLGDELLNKELVVSQKADFVVAGWNSGFSDQRGITPKILDKLGIQSFMHTESCYNYPGHPEKATPMEALYRDLERLGQIFRVEDRAKKVVADLQKRVAEVRRTPIRTGPPCSSTTREPTSLSPRATKSRPTTSSVSPAGATSSRTSRNAGHRSAGKQ